MVKADSYLTHRDEMIHCIIKNRIKTSKLRTGIKRTEEQMAYLMRFLSLDPSARNAKTKMAIPAADDTMHKIPAIGLVLCSIFFIEDLGERLRISFGLM